MKKQAKSEIKVNIPDGEEWEAQLQEEEKRLRRMRIMVDLVNGVLYQDQALTLNEARRLVAATERAVLRLFPGKQFAFDLILRPRFERILQERWRRGLDEVIH